MTWRVEQGDCIEVMAAMDEASVDAVVCDPPYGIGFMGHEWDQPGEHGPISAGHGGCNVSYGGVPHPAMEAGRYDLSRTANGRFQSWCEAWGREALRVLKPGGHAVVFGGTRAYHRLTCGLEDAGFEIRDSLLWLYGSGFPKSHDVSKAIDKAAGAHREAGVPGRYSTRRPREKVEAVSSYQDGIGDAESALVTAPATPAAGRWQGWGTALKPAHEPIVMARKPLAGTVAANVLQHGTGALNIDGCRIEGTPESPGTTPATANGNGQTLGAMTRAAYATPAGRWPANVILGHSHAGLSVTSLFTPTGSPERNDHPTVKPIALMRWLVRLVTPPGGTVLDPFTGSGTTGCAAVLEGFDFIGIEREAQYLAIARARIAHFGAMEGARP